MHLHFRRIDCFIRHTRRSVRDPTKSIQPPSTYPVASLVFSCCWFFFRLGVGIRHSMEKATQLVQGTPRLAASHRTCTSDRSAKPRITTPSPAGHQHQKQGEHGGFGPFAHGKSVDSRSSQIHVSAEQFCIIACVGGLLVQQGAVDGDARASRRQEMPRFTALDLLAARSPGRREDVPRMLATRAACNVI